MAEKLKNDKVKANKNNLPDERSLWGRFLSSSAMFLMRFFTQINYVNSENIPNDLPYVIAPNHQTYIDGLMVAKGLPKDHFKKFSALIGADLKTDHGIIGKMILPVARGIEVERYGNPVRGLVMACRAAKAGNIILVHPEGTRTHDGLVAPLQSGAAYIAMKSDIPLIPVYIEGGFEVFSRYDKIPKRKNTFTKKKNVINIIYGKAMLPQDYKDADEFTKAIENWLKAREAEYLEKNVGKLRPRPNIDQTKEPKE